MRANGPGRIEMAALEDLKDLALRAMGEGDPKLRMDLIRLAGMALELAKANCEKREAELAT